MQNVIMWTAAACQGNPGAGGYAVTVFVPTPPGPSGTAAAAAPPRSAWRSSPPSPASLPSKNPPTSNSAPQAPTSSTSSTPAPSKPIPTSPRASCPARAPQHRRRAPKNTGRARTTGGVQQGPQGLPAKAHQARHRLRVQLLQPPEERATPTRPHMTTRVHPYRRMTAPP